MVQEYEPDSLSTLALPSISLSFLPALALALGPTNSCSTTVHTKPFSTSAFQALLGIFATSTKICTHNCFDYEYSQFFKRLCQPSYFELNLSLTQANFEPCSFSSIHFQG